MIEFEPLTIKEKDLVGHYLSINQYPNSEYNFTTMYAWQEVYHTQYCVVHDCLCLGGVYEGRQYFYFPLGKKENVLKALKELYHYAQQRKSDFIFTSLSEEMLEILKQNGMIDCFQLEARRDFDDYVYPRTNLTELKGKKLHGKRNHFNFFEKNYNYTFQDITEENEQDCRALLIDLIDGRSVTPEDEKKATIRVLEDREILGLIGKCLYVEDKLVGVILGERHHDMALIQIAKANIEYRGASVALFKFFLQEYLTDCELVNFMEDMGLEGLRNAKLSYNPVYFVEKFTCKLIKPLPFNEAGIKQQTPQKSFCTIDCK